MPKDGGRNPFIERRENALRPPLGPSLISAVDTRNAMMSSFLSGDSFIGRMRGLANPPLIDPLTGLPLVPKKKTGIQAMYDRSFHD